MTTTIITDDLHNGHSYVEKLLGAGWYIQSTMPNGPLQLWRDSRGRVRTDGRIHYWQGTPSVIVRVKCSYKTKGFEHYVWACHHTTIQRAQIPTNRQKREALVRNIIAVRTLSFGDSKPRSKHERS